MRKRGDKSAILVLLEREIINVFVGIANQTWMIGLSGGRGNAIPIRAHFICSVARFNVLLINLTNVRQGLAPLILVCGPPGKPLFRDRCFEHLLTVRLSWFWLVGWFYNFSGQFPHSPCESTKTLCWIIWGKLGSD